MYIILFIIWLVFFITTLYECINDDLRDFGYMTLGRLAMSIVMAIFGFLIVPYIGLRRLIASDIWEKPIIRKKEEKHEEEKSR